MHQEKKLNSEPIYNGKIIKVKKDTVLLENGKETSREVVVHNGAVCIAALDEEDNLLFVRQFRYPYNTELLELPAGKRDGDEDPQSCGRRELEEETGYRANRFEKLAVFYPTAAYCTEVIHIFYATDLVRTEQCLDEDEFLTVERIPFSAALEMVLRDEIPDAKTQIAILKLYALRQNNR